MKLVALQLSQVTGKNNKSYDFSSKWTNLTPLTGINVEALATAIKIALLGGAVVGSSSLTVDCDGKLYRIDRKFDSKEVTVFEGDSPLYGAMEAEAFIADTFKLTPDALEKLLVVNDDTVKGFLGSDAERDACLTGLLDSLLPDRSLAEDNATLLAGDTAAKETELERKGQFDAASLNSIKSDMDNAALSKEHAENDLAALRERIAVGKKVDNAIKNLQAGTESMEGFIAGEDRVVECNEALEKSAEAEKLVGIIESRDKLHGEIESLEEEKKALSAALDKTVKSVESGRKSKAKLEEVVVHCLERLDEYKKILMQRIEEFDKEPAREALKAEIGTYFEDEEKQIAILTERNKQIDDEYAATEATYKELTEKIADIEKKYSAFVRHAVRDAAVLETSIQKTNAEIVEAHDNMEFCNARCNELVPDIKALKETTASGRETYNGMFAAVVGKYKTKEAAINANVIEKQSLVQAQIAVVNQEKESEAIEQKIAENLKTVSDYKEDLLALENAKKGIESYIEKVKDKNLILENEMLTVKSKLTYAKELGDLQYGERCPVCKKVVLDKVNNNDEEKYEKQLAKLSAELAKSKEAYAEYEGKYVRVIDKISSLTTNIAISNGYVDSLKASIQARKNNVADILAKHGAKDSAELTQRLYDAIGRGTQLQHLLDDMDALGSALSTQEANLALKEEQKKRIEEEDIPRYNALFEKLSAELNGYKTKLESIKESLGENSVLEEKTALEIMDDMSVAEKELETLGEQLAEKRDKLFALNTERGEVYKVLLLMSNRNKTVVVDGDECDYPHLVSKLLVRSTQEIIEEIRKSDEEVDKLKVELSATAAVLKKAEEAIPETEVKLKLLETDLKGKCDLYDVMQLTADESKKKIGVEDDADVAKYIISAEDVAALKEKMKKFYDDKAMVGGVVKQAQKFVEENHAYYEELEENLKKEAELKKSIEDLTQLIMYLTVKFEDGQQILEEVSELKSKIAFNKKRGRFYTEVIAALATNDTFADYIVKRASAKIAKLSADKYTLVKNGSAIELHNAMKNDSVIPTAKYTAEEKLLVKLVIGTTINATIVKIFNGEPLPFIIDIDGFDDKASARVLLNYSKRSPLVVNTGKELFRSLDKVSI